MIKLQRTTEYALLALKHILKSNQLPGSPSVSAREIAEAYHLPFEITAKTLQRLRDQRVIRSTQGVKGGYRLNSDLKVLGLGEFLTMIEGEQALVGCVSAESPCEYTMGCSLKPVMNALHKKIMSFLNTMSVEDLIRDALIEEKNKGKSTRLDETNFVTRAKQDALSQHSLRLFSEGEN